MNDISTDNIKKIVEGFERITFNEINAFLDYAELNEGIRFIRPREDLIKEYKNRVI